MYRYLLLVVAAFLTLQISAQAFKAGAVLGLLGCQVDGDSYGGYHQAGGIAGVFVEREFTHQWGGLMEVRWISKGAASDPDFEDGYRLRTSYAQIPVLVVYNLHPNWRLEFGPSVGIFLSKTEEDIYGVAGDEAWQPYNDFEIAALGGFSYVINDHFRLSARMSLSLLPVRDIISDDVTSVKPTWFSNDLGNQYNRTLEFTLYWLW